MRYEDNVIFDYLSKITTPRSVCTTDETVKMYVPDYEIMHNLKGLNIPFLCNFNNSSRAANVHMFLKYLRDQDPTRFTPFTVILVLCSMFYSESSYDNKYTRFLKCDNFWLFVGKTSRLSFLCSLTDEDDDICFVKTLESTISKLTVNSLVDFTYKNKIVITDAATNFNKTMFDGFPFKRILRFMYYFSQFIMMRDMDHVQNLNPVLKNMQKLYGVAYRYDEMEYSFRDNNVIVYKDAITSEKQYIDMNSEYSVIENSNATQQSAAQKLTSLLEA